MAAAPSSSLSAFELNSVVWGHHIYKELWTPIIGDSLDVQYEPSNPYDPRAVPVLRNGIVGHVPREVRRHFIPFCWLEAAMHYL